MRFILFLTVFSFSAYSQINPVICEEDVIEKLANGLSLPNCLNSRINRNPETKDEAICKTCKEKFESLYPDTLVKTDKEKIKKEFLNASLQEYRKSLINNVLDAIKIRSLPATGADFEKSIKDCSLKSKTEFKTSCKNPENIKLLEDHPLFKDIKKEIANEVATFINNSQGFNQKPTLLNRSENKCFISEQHLMLITSSSTEEEFTPEVIQFLSQVDTSKYGSSAEILASQEFQNIYKGDQSELDSAIKNHPILSRHFSSPDSIKSFFSKVKAPHSKNSFKSLIYSKTEGDELDKTLAKNCSDSFTKFKETICSDEFSKGDLALDPATNFRKLFNQDLETSTEQYAKSEDLVNKNLTLFQYCGNYAEKGLRLKDQLSKISGGLEERLQTLPLKDFENEKYNREIKSPNEVACAAECKGHSIACKIKSKFDLLKNPATEEYKLAHSSNDAGNSILRSMIGDKSELSPKTIDILVAGGILPKEDGTFVAQPDIPERQQDYFSNEVKRESFTSLRPTSNRPIAGATSKRAPTAETTIAPIQHAVSSFANERRETEETVEGLSDIENEIRRRLAEIPGGVPQNRNQARSIVRSASREKRKTLSPQQENNMIDEMMNRSYSPVLPGPGRTIASTRTPEVSDTPSLAEKWKKGQRDAALMDMAGAHKLSTSDIIDMAAEDAPKVLTTIPLNIVEDPRITLSDIFNDKITRNDAETQLIKVLLRNRKDFVLKLKDMNFKVLFDQKNSFNVLLEPGTNEEALRYKPQLELFLKRLKV